MHWMLLPLKRYAEFHGRSTRTEFWMYTLFQFLLMMLILAIAIPVAMASGGNERQAAGRMLWAMIPIAVIALGFAVPTIAVTVRRLHDQNLSGWLYLLSFVPYLGGLAILVMMCLPGTKGPNRFGPDPLGRPDPDVAKVFS